MTRLGLSATVVRRGLTAALIGLFVIGAATPAFADGWHRDWHHGWHHEGYDGDGGFRAYVAAPPAVVYGPPGYYYRPAPPPPPPPPPVYYVPEPVSPPPLFNLVLPLHF